MCNFRNFKSSVTLTLTLDRVEVMLMRISGWGLFTSNYIEIGKKKLFCGRTDRDTLDFSKCRSSFTKLDDVMRRSDGVTRPAKSWYYADPTLFDHHKLCCCQDMEYVLSPVWTWYYEKCRFEQTIRRSCLTERLPIRPSGGYTCNLPRYCCAAVGHAWRLCFVLFFCDVAVRSTARTLYKPRLYRAAT